MPKGMYQNPNGKGGHFPTWHVRRDVPDDLRQRFGRVLKKSTGESDHRKAERVADRIWQQWSEQFAAARALGTGPILTLDNALAAIEAWRSTSCEEAGRDFTLDPLPLHPALQAAVNGILGDGVNLLDPRSISIADANTPVRLNAAVWANRYFAENPSVSEGVALPHTVGLRIGRLQQAAVHEKAWVEISGFDEEMDEAIRVGGGKGILPTEVRERARHRYAVAALEVARHRENQRRRAATILATMNAASSEPSDIVIPMECPL